LPLDVSLLMGVQTSGDHPAVTADSTLVVVVVPTKFLTPTRRTTPEQAVFWSYGLGSQPVTTMTLDQHGVPAVTRRVPLSRDSQDAPGL
jgi:hypothetical protein